MDCQNLVFSRHAIQQMFFRKIDKNAVNAAIAYGEIIEERLDDTPFPSYLILDFIAGQPLHIVLSYDEATETCYVVTAYIPNLTIWQDDFKTRRN